MATRFPEIDPTRCSLDEAFASAEEQIRSFFDTIVNAVFKRRDQLLEQLIKIKLDYLNKEEVRRCQVKELEMLIEGMDKLNFKMNPVLKVKQSNLDTTKLELEKCQLPNPIPDPYFNIEDIHGFLQKLESLGTIQFDQVYARKVKPVKAFEHKKGDCFIGLCLDENNIYVCGHGDNQVQIFSKNGKLLGKFGEGQLSYGYGITLHKDWVFLSDRNMNAVFKFNASYNYKFECKSVIGVLSFPRGLAVNTNNEVLVADSKNHRIAIFNSGLQQMREMGNGSLKTPCDIKLKFDKIFVIDKGITHNVHIFSSYAEQIIFSMINFQVDTSWGSKLFWTDDIFLCFDQFGNIIISHSGNQTIQIFTLEGNLLHSIACEGYPTGIAVTDDNTIVCAMYNPSTIHFY